MANILNHIFRHGESALRYAIPMLPTSRGLKYNNDLGYSTIQVVLWWFYGCVHNIQPDSQGNKEILIFCDLKIYEKVEKAIREKKFKLIPGHFLSCGVNESIPAGFAPTLKYFVRFEERKLIPPIYEIWACDNINFWVKLNPNMAEGETVTNVSIEIGNRFTHSEEQKNYLLHSFVKFGINPQTQKKGFECYYSFPVESSPSKVESYQGDNPIENFTRLYRVLCTELGALQFHPDFPLQDTIRASVWTRTEDVENFVDLVTQKKRTLMPHESFLVSPSSKPGISCLTLLRTKPVLLTKKKQKRRLSITSSEPVQPRKSLRTRKAPVFFE